MRSFKSIRGLFVKEIIETFESNRDPQGKKKEVPLVPKYKYYYSTVQFRPIWTPDCSFPQLWYRKHGQTGVSYSIPKMHTDENRSWNGNYSTQTARPCRPASPHGPNYVCAQLLRGYGVQFDGGHPERRIHDLNVGLRRWVMAATVQQWWCLKRGCLRVRLSNRERVCFFRGSWVRGPRMAGCGTGNMSSLLLF